MSAVASFGHFAQIPINIVTARVSPSSKSVWNLMAAYASQEKPEVWVRQETFAEKLGVSVDTIYRAIKELIRKGLILETGRTYLGRYKTYRLQWFFGNTAAEITKSDARPSNAPTYRKNAEGHTAKMRKDVPQICGHINRVSKSEQKTEYSFSEPSQLPKVEERESESLLRTFGEDWKKIFPCLDGLSGRPSLKECVEQGLAHKARKNYSDLKIFLDGWLRNASQKWIFSFNKEQNALPTDSALDLEAQKRRAEADTKLRLEQEQKRAERLKREEEEARVARESRPIIQLPPESEAERAWIVARIKGANEEKRKKAEADSRSSRGIWGNLKKAPKIEEDPEIIEKNYPIMWNFLRQLWVQDHSTPSQANALEVSNG